MTRVRIAPSILSADFAKLREELVMCETAGADWVHVDVMDGRFVPNLTYGEKVIETCNRCVKMPLDVHLMVVQPENYYDAFAKAGADVLTIHAETARHLHRQIQRIKELGCKAGVALNPATSVSMVEEVLSDIDLLLIMTVNPGFGGQKYIETSDARIAHAREMLTEAESHAVLEVDGGISEKTIARCRRAGADTFVAGNAIFKAPKPPAAIAELRRLAEE